MPAMARWLALCACLVGCTDEVTGPSDAAAVPTDGNLRNDLANFRSQWTGKCCGLVCGPGQLCVMEADGYAYECAPVPDSGVCAPQICGTGCGSPHGMIAGCPVGSFAHCEDYPPACLDNPTCACLAPLENQYENCGQICRDDLVVSDGILRCNGL
jgi:hypothetical protein